MDDKHEPTENGGVTASSERIMSQDTRTGTQTEQKVWMKPDQIDAMRTATDPESHTYL